MTITSIDLLVLEDDLVLSSIGEPDLTTASNCVAQDICHMIREKGYAIDMIGQRSQVEVATKCKQIQLEIEEDVRIIPGTARVHLDDETLICEARTIDNEKITVNV
ncbi:MAG: DUF2590 domain-containing protein [Marinomonas sp.]|nr:MAG: DUF2590 domain-containing protein [Marinomonas sp.]